MVDLNLSISITILNIKYPNKSTERQKLLNTLIKQNSTICFYHYTLIRVAKSKDCPHQC